ncbi:MAG: cyclase family protein [Thermodesulfobacteriota bacterium]
MSNFSKRFLILLTALLALFTADFSYSQPDTLMGGEWIDLSHDFSSETIYWPTAQEFKLETVFQGYTDEGFFYESHNFSAAEHGGTHVDAPIHFAKGKLTADQIPLENLIGPGVVIDVSKKALPNPDYQVSVEDFKMWEAKHGKIADGSIVFLNTGYAQYWPDRVKYMGTDKRGPEAVAELHFPGLDPKAAAWLVENRNIAAIGLDAPSIDYGQSKLYQAHQILFKENIPAFENVANLDKLPPKGAFIIALPMKIKNGSGAPTRIIAKLPE